MYAVNSFSIRNKQVISGNNSAVPQLPTDAVSIMQCIFSFDNLLGTVQLLLTFSFRPLNWHLHLNCIGMNIEVEIYIQRMQILTGFFA